MGCADSWWHRPDLGTCNVTSLGSNETELVRDVEHYQLAIAGLTATYSLGSGTQLLERGWTKSHSGIAQGERCCGGVGILTTPLSVCLSVGIHLGGRERCFSADSYSKREGSDCVCAYVPNTSSEYSAFWESLDGLLEGVPTGDFLVTLDDFNASLT